VRLHDGLAQPSALTPATVRVLLVDDQPAFRQAARELLELKGYLVVGEAGAADEALDAAGRFLPDAVLLDVRLGDASGFDVSLALTRAHPTLAVLLVSAEPSYAQCHALAHASGAVGIVLKSKLPGIELAGFWASDAPRPVG
jgi:DNA-binding NarL/FixJ family response regulator